ncbi:DUF3322 domain-containing protein [Salinisphaera sp. P385]|uniref:DUF3322 domain-containing protein n=1 Tax=Spectribacter acetivorans TaxID=3075603 RepID=A0ABU3BBQ8_9GAMM|nr:DUF3322 domain-containing protein [Salinisphaera sp. P385]MDT0619916.1 DUF3322 domain-containing protein [Salinisphaera sp. P385]
MSRERQWATPADLRAQVEKYWRCGAILAGQITGEAQFPLSLRLRGPTGGEVAQRFDAVRDWIRELREGSREGRGFGYELQWREVRNRVHGGNRLPVGAFVPTAADALRLIGRQRDAERFAALVDLARRKQPGLLEWLARKPLTALRHAEDWPALLAVVGWFRENPRPDVYMRQLDIPGVHTKLIENRRRLLGELLDEVLPEHAIDRHHAGARGFEARYGLRQRPVRLRFRFLDTGLHLHGLSDLTVSVDEFARLPVDLWATPVERVFITENEINGLAFPRHPRSLVIFGLGYALDHLGAIPWLHRTDVHYWGDIDTHGFAILDRLRHHLLHAQSLLMDREVLDAHRDLWGCEPRDRRFTGEPSRLASDEATLFRAIRDNELGTNLRLEQERIGYGWLRRRLDYL